jgi:hypothetical protein
MQPPRALLGATADGDHSPRGFVKMFNVDIGCSFGDHDASHFLMPCEIGYRIEKPKGATTHGDDHHQATEPIR